MTVRNRIRLYVPHKKSPSFAVVPMSDFKNDIYALYSETTVALLAIAKQHHNRVFSQLQKNFAISIAMSSVPKPAPRWLTAHHVGSTDEDHIYDVDGIQLSLCDYALTNMFGSVPPLIWFRFNAYKARFLTPHKWKTLYVKDDCARRNWILGVHGSTFKQLKYEGKPNVESNKGSSGVLPARQRGTEPSSDVV